MGTSKPTVDAASWAAELFVLAMITGAATDRGISVTSSTAVPLMTGQRAAPRLGRAAAVERPRYLNGSATATADRSLQIGTGEPSARELSA